MDEKQKLNIVENLVNHQYNKDYFIEFITNILNVTVKMKNEYSHIRKEYMDYIESYQEYCDYQDNDGQKIYIIAVKIKNINEYTGKEIDPVKARGKQRDFLAGILRERKRDGALAVFYNENELHWRISLVKLDYAFTLDGLKEILTPAKRFSYVVGKNENNKTAIDQLYLLSKLDETPTLKELEETFKLEKVTDDFFKSYKEKYLQLKEHLEKESSFMKLASSQINETQESFVQGFTKKLMGQIAFLYFLQKKGWLGVNRVPKELNNAEFNRIYQNASEKGKIILNESYILDDFEKYKLHSRIKSFSEEDSEILANCFKNIREYDSPWGNGDKKFIRTLFDRHIAINSKTGKNKNFFDDYLEPLFYSCLNVNRGESDYFSLFNCRIPYLNGGLFEAYGEYNWKETSFHIPDEIFSNNVDGILDIFDRYNFTISENEPYETEVAVDPEMLGKVFENLLDINDRKSKGAFYTPREIVHYMCKESLEKFLINKIDGISKIDIEYLIQLGEFTKGYDQHIFEIDYIKSIKEEIEFIPSWGMPKFVRENAKLIDDVLKSCKVADPAIGSGAFPLGMLTEIVKARNTLTMYIIIQEGLELSKTDIKKYWELKRRKENDRSLYNLKLNTIENSLFGVDLEPSAIEIAKLRLWLSIVVDTASESIKPLPNLDFNFRCGDSLVEDYYGIKLFDETILNKKLPKKNDDKMKIEFTEEEKLQNIITLHHQFFNPYVKDKKGLKEQIEDLEWKLIETNLYKNNEFLKIEEIKKLQGKNQKPYFIWKLEFGEVFRDNGGFDIVIGNPPYLRVQGIKEFNPELAETYKEKYKSATGSYDLYVLFTERALQLVKNNGIVNFIMPHKWTNASFGKGLREVIGLGKYMSKFISFGSYQVFNASTYTSLIWLEKTENQFMNYYEFNKDITDNKMLESSLNSLIDKSYVKMDNLELKPLEVKKGNKISYKDKLWNFMPKDNKKIIDRINNHQRKCESIFTSMFQGIATSKDSVYFLHDCKEIDNNLIEGYSQELEEIITIEKGIVKPLLKGDMVHRYDSLVTDKYIIYPYNNENELYSEDYLKKNYPLCWNYFKLNETILKDREGGKFNIDDWFQFGRKQGMKYANFEKLMAPDISLGCNFSYDKKGYFYSTTTVYGYVKKDNIQESYKFLMSILNSKVLWYYLVNTGAVMANGYFRFKTNYIKPFPIPEINDLERTKPFEILVDYITFLKKEKSKFNNFVVSPDYLISFYEDILNSMVYELYFDVEMKENDLEIISFSQKYILNIVNINIEESVAIIKNTYLKLSESENELRNNIILMKLRLEELIGPIDRSI